ncbi:probable C-mannosyltransferase DPY19L4 [Eublepharis macularius]|uniref:Probable C-mannosyltransferase DPY19L4 n=1 Tax=Eublepharis macularius TaxID=481883 RepID=A0AA97JRK0_EUBMA|nr:probable C-mannosyltransferase DPY19L4 [Eublepharis macularius]
MRTVEVRQRKKPNGTETEERAPEEGNEENKKPKKSPRYDLIPRFAKLFFGCVAAIVSGMMYAMYLSTYHERKFWFSGRPVFMNLPVTTELCH